MAKMHKKTESKEKPAPKAPAKKAAHKPKPAGMGSSLIDTSLAAENAARQLVAGINRKGGSNPSASNPSPRPESSLFKQLKHGVNKPASMNSLLDKTHGPNPTQSHGFSKQTGHNQTMGSEAARTNVPRRTNG